ncbi:hypothetical protein [Macrococcoides caseolyticum]|uniref:hypothetical protein n=1 Tax=Macrococcoides caseolyticum TaxID=69966 RepID=UPI000C33A36D|nr:hypothetical protein [Macrococcus caseolyticus]PKE16732.1 hypothetical protein CW718_08120 [Macrococcus caseolyticus]
MTKNILPTVARTGMTEAFYTGIQEGYEDVLNEIEEMKEDFEGNAKEMFVLKALEKTILLQSKVEAENKKREMNKYNIKPKKKSLYSRLFTNKKA